MSLQSCTHMHVLLAHRGRAVSANSKGRRTSQANGKTSKRMKMKNPGLRTYKEDTRKGTPTECPVASCRKKLKKNSSICRHMTTHHPLIDTQWGYSCAWRNRPRKQNGDGQTCEWVFHGGEAHIEAKVQETMGNRHTDKETGTTEGKPLQSRWSRSLLPCLKPLKSTAVPFAFTTTVSIESKTRSISWTMWSEVGAYSQVRSTELQQSVGVARLNLLGSSRGRLLRAHEWMCVCEWVYGASA